jgi:hypothetical protein
MRVCDFRNVLERVNYRNETMFENKPFRSLPAGGVNKVPILNANVYRVGSTRCKLIRGTQIFKSFCYKTRSHVFGIKRGVKVKKKIFVLLQVT